MVTVLTLGVLLAIALTDCADDDHPEIERLAARVAELEAAATSTTASLPVTTTSTSTTTTTTSPPTPATASPPRSTGKSRRSLTTT